MLIIYKMKADNESREREEIRHERVKGVRRQDVQERQKIAEKD